MLKFKNFADVLELAVSIERQGTDFYNKLSSRLKIPQAKDVFSFLAAQEEKHACVFRQILEKVTDYAPCLIISRTGQRENLPCMQNRSTPSPTHAKGRGRDHLIPAGKKFVLAHVFFILIAPAYYRKKVATQMHRP